MRLSYLVAPKNYLVFQNAEWLTLVQCRASSEMLFEFFENLPSITISVLKIIRIGNANNLHFR